MRAPAIPGRLPAACAPGPTITWDTASFRPGLQHVPVQDRGPRTRTFPDTLQALPLPSPSNLRTQGGFERTAPAGVTGWWWTFSSTAQTGYYSSKFKSV